MSRLLFQFCYCQAVHICTNLIPLLAKLIESVILPLVRGDGKTCRPPGEHPSQQVKPLNLWPPHSVPYPCWTAVCPSHPVAAVVWKVAWSFYFRKWVLSANAHHSVTHAREHNSVIKNSQAWCRRVGQSRRLTRESDRKRSHNDDLKMSGQSASWMEGFCYGITWGRKGWW